MAEHASRIALAAYGATAGRVVRERGTRHVRRAGSRSGTGGGRKRIVMSGLLELLVLG